MHIFELCDQIRKRPGIFLDGDKSIRRLRSFLVGFEFGVGSTGGEIQGPEDMRKFNLWVASQLGYTESTSGWCNMILSEAGTDERAFDVFFEMLDKYKLNSL